MPNTLANATEPLWKAEDVASFLGLHVQTVYSMAKDGRLPSRKIGRGVRFDPSEIRAWLADQSRSAEAGEAS